MPLRTYLPSFVDPSLDLVHEIAKLKQQRNAIVLAHYYQDPDIQDIADFLGDSLQLAQEAARTKADVICFAGVHFMAETAKILHPTRIVVVPDIEAGCSLAESCPANRFSAWKDKHPEAVTVTYINCSAEVKALSDWIVTSSNAEKIVKQIPLDQLILFAPDRNLGRYLMQKTGRAMELWPGSCIVHETFSERKLLALVVAYPEAEVLAHPECDETLLRHAHFVGSTTAILKYALASQAKTFLVATEAGILHTMRKQAPEKTFLPAPSSCTCACNECPYMRKNTLGKVYRALRDLAPRIDMSERLLAQARLPLERMLAVQCEDETLIQCLMEHNYKAAPGHTQTAEYSGSVLFERSSHAFLEASQT